MRPRHPIAGLDRRGTHAAEQRREMLTIVAAVTAAALALIFALAITRP